jgi:tetratricopeptide (TPR) repeat protein
MDKITEEDGKEKQKAGTTSKKEDASSNASAVIGTGALLSDEVCASCGIAAVDNIELKDCNGGCDLVKYCSDDCQNNNWEQHEESCKKRLAELRDKDLLTQPKSSHLGDCPICLLPLSIDPTKSMLATCCCKIVCKGCEYANHKREIEAGLVRRCAFCREPAPKSEEEANKRIMKRVKKNDPVAMWKMGKERWDVGDYESALEYYKKGADLGDAYAHYYLSLLYKEGQGVEKDKEKYIYHSEEAAIGGNPMARHNLGIEDWNAGRYVKSVKHFIIAASLGYHDSLKSLMTRCAKGLVPKELYGDALRAYQATVDAAKSLERDEGEAAHEEQMKLVQQLEESGIDVTSINWPGGI